MTRYRARLRTLVLALAALVTARGGFAQFAHDIDSVRAAEDFRLGVQAYHRGRLAESTLLFERALASEADDPLILSWLGRAYYRQGYEATALAAWDEALALGGPVIALEAFAEYVRTRRGVGTDDSGRAMVVAGTIAGIDGRDRRFARPTWISAAADGSVLAVAFGSNEVLRFDVNGLLTARMRGGLRGYDRPFSLAPLPDGGFVLAEFGSDRISVCDKYGNVTAVFGEGDGDERLSGPQYVARDSDGYLYVSDYGNSRAVKFGPDGRFLFEFGKADASGGGLGAPSGIALLGDLVYVADRSGPSIEVFDLSGNHLESLVPVGLSSPEGISVDGGRLLVADGGRVMAIDPSSLAVTELHASARKGSRLLSAAFDANRNLVVADFDASLIEVLVAPSTVYSGWRVEAGRVDTSRFPRVEAEILVGDADGRPVVGLAEGNFHVTELVTSEEIRNEGGKDVAYRVEMMRSVEEFELIDAESDEDPLDLAFLVERSPEAERLASETRAVVGELAGELRSTDRAILVEAAANPALSHEGVGPELIRLAARGLPAARDWRFDLAVRLAASSLASGTGKPSILYVGSGSVNEGTLGRTALSELVALLRNNGIRFDAIVLGDKEPDAALSYIVGETGGTLRSSREPAGAAPLAAELRASRRGRYRVSWLSRAEDGFGRSFLGFAVEAYLYRMSGRDETGFFAPLR
ncbi:MAG: hypothetical protein JXA15_07040 [Spirochaetales bacterium]|nr:hypothetical protein [Spirochaetales bacterium]